MDCLSVRRQIHAYFDRELDLAGATAIERHLAGCPGCRAVLDDLAALRSGLQEHAARHGAPAGLAARIRAGIGEAAPRTASDAPARAPRRPWLRQWAQLGAALAAGAAVSWIATTLYYAGAEDARLAEQLFAAHARAALTEHFADVASSDQHTVKPWLSARLDFSPPVSDLAGAGFPLIGGRLDYVNERPVAVLVYKHRQHWIDLFVWPGAARTGETSKNGFNVLRWNDAGLAFSAVSDLNPAELKQFADALAAAK